MRSRRSTTGVGARRRRGSTRTMCWIWEADGRDCYVGRDWWEKTERFGRRYDGWTVGGGEKVRGRVLHEDTRIRARRTCDLKRYQLRTKAANVADESVDMIISNCVINLSPDKPAVLREAHRVLANGGEFYFSDVYCDRRLPEDLRSHEILLGEPRGGAVHRRFQASLPSHRIHRSARLGRTRDRCSRPRSPNSWERPSFTPSPTASSSALRRPRNLVRRLRPIRRSTTAAFPTPPTPTNSTITTDSSKTNPCSCVGTPDRWWARLGSGNTSPSSATARRSHGLFDCGPSPWRNHRLVRSLRRRRVLLIAQKHISSHFNSTRTHSSSTHVGNGPRSKLCSPDDVRLYPETHRTGARHVRAMARPTPAAARDFVCADRARLVASTSGRGVASPRRRAREGRRRVTSSPSGRRRTMTPRARSRARCQRERGAKRCEG